MSTEPAGLHQKLASLPANVQGALWMLVACVVFSAMGLGVKYVGEGMDSFQIGFIRALFGLIFVIPIILYRGVGQLKTNRMGLHITRSIFGITGMLSVMYTLTNMPLADSVALTFTRPLFVIVLAVIFLGEVVRWRRWMATIVGFGGVLLMVQASAEIGFATAVGLFGALMVGCVSVFLKKLSSSEAPTTIMFYFGLYGSLIAAVPAYFVWQTPSVEQVFLLGLTAAAGTCGNYCVIRAISVGETTAVMPYDYTRLIFSAIMAYFVFGEIPTMGMVAGACVIVASSLYIMRREAALKKKGAL
ncbi:EamA family transporter [Sneathiella sp. P13V-1]|uniref:DMT family transporter n=1 Tax=Sneathiella sp. P13V-1 TaxID=2697366 RepID=UPI00187B8C84|nr:DMT family transporter [Sneathiella sp. P13V-1]MBE7636435.1 EamA family transporter [Sneathiella sp. P13V-1]